MAWPRGGVMCGLDKKGLSVADRPIFAPNPDDSGSGGEAGSANHEDRGQNEATESTSPWGGRMLTRMPALGTLSEVRPGPRGRWGASLLGAQGLRPRQRQESRGTQSWTCARGWDAGSCPRWWLVAGVSPGGRASLSDV